MERLVDNINRNELSDPPPPIGWMEKNVKLPGSARSSHFNISVTPWLKDPILDMTARPERRITTLVKPVQSGGSVAGECVLLYWIRWARGFLQYNWSNDKRADERWKSRVEAILDACGEVGEMKGRALSVSKGEVNFGTVFFRMQGAFVPANLDSDSVPLQINEEVHDWEPGHLKKARNRSTAVWSFKSFDISNAGKKGDQLDQAFREGTQRHWVVRCPGCGKYHEMITFWQDKRPDLGGLRYDAERSRIGIYEYNYNILRPTIRYQMPCGLTVPNEAVAVRRALSDSGKYSDPVNVGAEESHQSYTYQAVAVDYIDWMTIIKDKHDALRARALGDPEPWRRYKCERECVPYDPDDVPVMNINPVVKGIKKSREGLPIPRLRLGALDRQQGHLRRGEFPHWWLVVRDFKVEDSKLRSRLVWEGKCETDEQAVQTLKDLGVNPWHVVADSGDDTSHVYRFCMANGINAIKGGAEFYYAHPGGHRRIFSKESPLHAMLQSPPLHLYITVGRQSIPDPREPMFWLYSKYGIRERLHWLMNETLFETPEDVSDDYQSHMEAEERVEHTNPSDGSREWRYVQRKSRNDLYVCECYIAMQVDQAGLVLVDQYQKQIHEAKTSDPPRTR